MTDTLETPSAAPVDDARARNKAIVFAALAEAGIHRVIVEYDGCGDSGQIEYIEARDASDEKLPLPSIPKVQLASAVPENPPVEITFQEAIEILVYDYLEETYMGWENNDGAFGTFVFDVAESSITLEHSERYTEYNTTSHEF
jgi:hypothetical protein